MVLKTIPLGVGLPISDGVKFINDAIEAADKAKTQSATAISTANTAKDSAEQTRVELDQAILSGDSSPLAGQLSVGSDAVTYPSAQERFLQEREEVTSQLADIAINVKTFGAVSDWDGTTGTDNTAAFQSAVDYVASKGGGTVLFNGKYKTTRAIKWVSGVGLRGVGIAKSVLVPVGTGYGAIENISTIDNPLVDCVFEDFEIDGINMGDDTLEYNVREKALFIQFMKRAIFSNLYLHDTPATALGCDFLDDSIIENVIVERGGRLFGINGGTPVGGSGIGVGTGAWEYENLKIIGCEARDCGNYGIFVEIQRDQPNPLYSKGIRIIGCNASGNDRAGISDKGVENLVVTGGCNIHDNYIGFELEDTGINALISGNIIRDNTDVGILLGPQITAEGYKIIDNDIYNNGTHGILSQNNLNDVMIKNNRVFSNGGCGVFLAATILNNPEVSNNRIYNNGTSSISGYAQGLLLDADITNPKINDNKIFDGQATKTQTFGISIGSSNTITNGEMSRNDCRGNKNGTFSIRSIISGEFIARDNYDHNNLPNITSLVGDPSPYTYTANYRPEKVYLIGGGIGVAKKGSNVLVDATTAIVDLRPYDEIVITYSTLTSIKIEIF